MKERKEDFLVEHNEMEYLVEVKHQYCWVKCLEPRNEIFKAFSMPPEATEKEIIKAIEVWYQAHKEGVQEGRGQMALEIRRLLGIEEDSSE